MHKSIIVILLFIIYFSFTACEDNKNYIYSKDGNPEELVYIVLDSKEYHRADCINIINSNKVRKLHEVIWDYWPCKDCKPPNRLVTKTDIRQEH